MQRRIFLASLAAIASLAGQAPAAASALGRLAQVSVVDRQTGREIPAHLHRGEYWIAGRPGARYAIRIHNLQGERLLAVAAVDGINVVTGATARTDQNGYVFDGYSGYDIDGWRKSVTQVAAFEFTAVPASYAARTGRAENIGIIGVALFREAPLPGAVLNSPSASQDKAQPAAPPARYRGQESDQSSARTSNEASAQASGQVPGLGTGHGARETSLVSEVEFKRRRASPDEVIRIRYDSVANLVAMGVIPRVRAEPRVPQPFPAEPSVGYVPDP